MREKGFEIHFGSFLFFLSRKTEAAEGGDPVARSEAEKMTTPSVLKERQYSDRKSKRDLKTLLDIVEPKLMVNRYVPPVETNV